MNRMFRPFESRPAKDIDVIGSASLQPGHSNLRSAIGNRVAHRLARAVATPVGWISIAILVSLIVFLLSARGASNSSTSPIGTPGEDIPVVPTVQRYDHSVVNLQSTAHESDEPGASIAEYGPLP